jgi:hypothetical protein
MATSAVPLEQALHVETHELSFIRKYIFSTDHKIIGIQFLLFSLSFLLLGGMLAGMMRWQLGFPDAPMPVGTVLPETMAPDGILLPEFYNSLVTMHGTFDDAQKKRLTQVAARCPVHKTLANGVHISDSVDFA